MINYLIMGGIVCFLALVLLVGIKREDSANHFFDITNSKAMRGFWCLVVILVHIPATYQNRIQDMIGSFAYIGVTFFFMTSGFGLTLADDKKGNSVNCFWRNRLPKLLIPGWIINVFFAVVFWILFSDEVSVKGLLRINDWVKWLLACYLLFWISHIVSSNKTWKVITSILIVILSVVFYLLKVEGLYTRTSWTTECYGFVWGILLATILGDFISFFQNKWLKKWIGSLLFALLLGVAYLKFKPIVFLGDYVLKIILGVAITLFILISNVRFSLGNKVSLFLGKISFEVYLIHGNVFQLVSRLFPQVSSGVFILCSLILTILMAYITHIVSNVILKQLYKMEFFRKN